MIIRINHRFHGVLPKILNDVSELGLLYNLKYPREFDPSFRCIAFAFNGNKLICFGKNKNKTHTFTKKLYHDHFHNTIHAEADLVMNLLKSNNIDNTTDLMVLRGTSKLLDSHPCNICTGLFGMYFTNVRMWYYSMDHDSWRCELI